MQRLAILILALAAGQALLAGDEALLKKESVGSQGSTNAPGVSAPAPEPPAPPQPPHAAASGESLFDGKSLGNWKATDFSGKAGAITVADGAIRIAKGEPMSGITWSHEPPARMNYEIELEAMRTEGNDFFCGLTFPVGESPCTLICGGWGGTLVGLSSIDGFDASENMTTRFIQFKSARWYAIRVRVTGQKIQAWIDSEPIVDQSTEGHQISIRMEVEESKPLGIATWYTGSAVRNIRFRKL
jgi:hypothetical protein